MLNGIKNIIFDLGGVILNISYANTSKAFKDLGVTNFDEIYSQAQQNKLFDNVDKGLISSEEFCDEVRKLSNTNFSNEQINHAWNAMLLDLPAQRIELLTALSKNYRLFLLSNTNSTHMQVYHQYLKDTFGFYDLSHIFEKEYYSYKIHMRKPDSEIFSLVLNQNNLKPEETLFIDDSIQHIKGAESIGIKAFFLEKDKTILDVF